MTKKKNRKFKAQVMSHERVAIQEEHDQLMAMLKEPKSAVKVFCKFKP